MSGLDLLVTAAVPIALGLFTLLVFAGALLAAALLVRWRWRTLQRLATLDHRFEHGGHSLRLIVPGADPVRMEIAGQPATVRGAAREPKGGVHSLRTFTFEAPEMSGTIAVRYESWRPRSAEVRIDDETVFRTLEDFGQPV